jgi:hypothetical protein
MSVFFQIMKSRVIASAILAGLLLPGLCSQALGVGRPTISNHFTAVANDVANLTDSGNVPIVTDSRRTVTFFDSANIGNGPLFSVALPFEGQGAVNASAYEEFSSITVDRTTGDIYVLAFDNFNTASDSPTQYGVDIDGKDTTGDYDLYKINFQTVLNNWKTNFQGKDARTLGGALALGGPAPNVPVGGVATSTPPNTNQALTADIMKDYITYGVTTPYSAEVTASTLHQSPNGATDIRQSNGFVLNGAIEKIGEINRNRYTSTSNFFNPTLNFIDPSKLFMIDDARQATIAGSGNNPANDYDYRMIERLSTSPGAAKVRLNGADVTATDPGRTAPDGGFNLSTTQSWESRRIGQMLLDTDETATASFLSDPQSSAYYSNGTIRGVWVADRDRELGGKNPVPDTISGDDVAFLQLDANGNSLGYRQFNLAGNPTKFELDNDPGGTLHGPGRVGQLFTASNGDLIVVEEGFRDQLVGGTNTFSDHDGLAPTEPGVFRGAVSYDVGGKISITWGPKTLLTPAKDVVTTTGLPNSFPELGYYSSYDPATNKVYFATPGTKDTTPQFHMNWFVLDLTTGVTSSYLNMDESVSLFVDPANNYDSQQKVLAFSLGVAGDYNSDGVVDAADYTVWRDHLGQTFALPNEASGVTTGMVTQEDYDYWKLHFGEGASGSGAGSLASGSVPEPTGIALAAIGMIGLLVGRRRFGR